MNMERVGEYELRRIKYTKTLDWRVWIVEEHSSELVYTQVRRLRMSSKGLFINDVIIFGGYRDPPLPLVIIRHFLATPPSSRA